MATFLKRTWAEIDLDAINYNFKCIRKHIRKDTLIMCIIKADAYGHGAPKLAEFYSQLGADYLGVSNLEEAIQIRKFGVNLPILILGYTPAEHIEVLVKNNITQTIVSEEHAVEFSMAAKKLNSVLNVHLKVDTGMSRLGIFAQNESNVEETINTIKDICTLENIKVQGIFTHMSCADKGENGEKFTNQQYLRFLDITNSLEKMGIEIPIKHCCNSACILDYPQYQMDMVRPGIILFGLFPSDNMRNKFELKPAMSLKSTISQIKFIHEDTSVGYGRSFVSEKDRKIATIPIGYADGYMRTLSDKHASVLINGKKANIIGKICMDQCMVDISNIDDAKVGDIVTILGSQGNETIHADDLAKACGTINYETVCLIGKRVPRIYYSQGKILGSLNYILN